MIFCLPGNLNLARRNASITWWPLLSLERTDTADGDTGSHLHGLSVRATHARRQTIGAGAGKHLVLAHDVEGVAAGADVVALFAGVLRQVLVAGNASGLQGAGSQLLFLVRHQVADEGEVVDGGALGTAVEDADLGIGDTSAEARLDVRLVLLEAAATCGS